MRADFRRWLGQVPRRRAEAPTIGTQLSPKNESRFDAANTAFWCLLILVPVALIARVLPRWPDPRVDTWATGIFTKQVARPIVGALAFYGTSLVGVQVWDHLPRIERGPLEFAVPGPDVYRAELAIIELHLMAL